MLRLSFLTKVACEIDLVSFLKLLMMFHCTRTYIVCASDPAKSRTPFVIDVCVFVSSLVDRPAVALSIFHVLIQGLLSFGANVLGADPNGGEDKNETCQTPLHEVKLPLSNRTLSALLLCCWGCSTLH